MDLTNSVEVAYIGNMVDKITDLAYMCNMIVNFTNVTNMIDKLTYVRNVINVITDTAVVIMNLTVFYYRADILQCAPNSINSGNSIMIDCVDYRLNLIDSLYCTKNLSVSKMCSSA